MKLLAITLACCLFAVSSAYAATRYLAVSGAGIGTDTDQSTAHSAADSMAQTNLNNTCPGTLTNTRKIFDQCSQVDGNYGCNVNYSAICVIN